MKGQSKHPRLMSVFPHREKEDKPFVWYRKYYDPKTEKVYTKQSLSQQNPSLMFGKDRISGRTI